MKKLLQSLFTIFLGLVAFGSSTIAEETNVDKQDIIAACTQEAKGAMDIDEYIESCIKDKEEEFKEMVKKAAEEKEKS